LERIHPEDRARAAATVALALMDNRAFSMDERIVRPDGRVRQLRSHGEVGRDEGGRPLKVVGACIDVTEQKAAEAALRALTRRLVEAEETERRRIARELHDRVGQNLSALNINLDILLGQLRDEPARRRLEDSLKLVDATLQSIENVMADLTPALLDEYGLAAALAWYGEEYAQRTGIRVGVQAGEAGASLRPEAAGALFRIAQEALNNAAKHTSAKRITVGLEEKEGELVLRVSDDGKGFDPASAPRGRWGMTTMRERAEAAGGRLSVESSPGSGTTVSAAVPLSHDDPHHQWRRPRGGGRRAQARSGDAARHGSGVPRRGRPRGTAPGARAVPGRGAPGSLHGGAERRRRHARDPRARSEVPGHRAVDVRRAGVRAPRAQGRRRGLRGE